MTDRRLQDHAVFAGAQHLQAAGGAADHADAARVDEVTRTRTYYDDMLAALDRWRRSATPEGRGMLDATRAERSRRLAEVEEKFRPAHTIRLFRLHVLWVPALRLPCVVLRGHRESR